ncbi:Outer membrane receptor proteins, mostly Fe transport [Moheibacter sediminis]|uniref:Outer membrane receptor proteins, mostly Fe transport n=2 Tax=Moheibacter sediminis TaxID=1434700 RepID=A0A1W1ZL67_9FLAO|nr:Outer membrane receptor proteins, mostly Fe transport [Moheibacter sediminis]
MNMRLLTMVFFLMLSAMSFANDKKGTITGKVQDGAGKAIPYASIEIYTKGETQSLVSGGMSEDDGTFVIEGIDYGTYELVITAVGFNDKVQDINVQNAATDLGGIVMGSDIVVLEGAEIRAETSQYRTEIDKRVVDVGKDLVSAGADAASVLNNIPSVSVDQQTGALSLRGNENVKVMVDGKPSNIPAAQLLKQLPSNAIAKVEIITNPSAKYDPEGNSGIINIITHKNKRKGYNVGLDLGYTLGDNSRHNGSVNANVNTGSFNFFGNYNANFGRNRFHGEVNNYDTLLDQFFDVNDENNSQVFKVGFDWFIGEKTALTLYTSQFYNRGEGGAQANVFDNEVNTLFYNHSDVDGKYDNQDYSLNFKQDFGKENHNIVLDAIYSTSDNKDTRNYVNTFPIETFSEWRKGKNENTRINLDYTNQIIDGGKIEAGLQFRQEKNENDMLSTQVLDNEDDQGNPFTYSPDVDYQFTRDIYSAYVNYGQTFGKFGMQLGVRAERVEENADYNVVPTGVGTFKNDYTEFYPSAFLTYDVTERGQILLNYSRRVDRPWIGQMTPVPEWTTPTMTSEGNPELRPQFTNSYELGYLQRFKGGSLNATAFYRKVNDVLFRYLENKTIIVNGVETPTVVQKYINYEDSESYGVELSANYKPVKWWSFNASFDIFANKFYLGEEEVTGTPWNFRINNNINLTKDLSVQNFFMYRGPFKFIQGEMQPMWRMDLGMRYSFMDGKAAFTARVSDIFKTFNAEAHITNPTPGLGQFFWESQTLYVGFSYNFGGEVRKRHLNQESNQSGGGGGIGF